MDEKTDAPSGFWGDGSASSEPGKISTKWWLISVPVALILCLLVPILFAPQKPESDPQIARPPEKQISDALTYDNFRVKQSVLETSSGQVLLQHYPYHFESIPKYHVLEGEFAELHFDPSSPWYEGFTDHNVLATFNCGTFAVGFDIELTPYDLLDAVPLNGYPNPLEVILSEYYRAVASIGVNQMTTDESLLRTTARPGDVICLINESKSLREYTHVARLDSIDRGVRILSKMGRRGPIMSTNLNFLLRHYSDTNKLEIYRLKPKGT